MRENYQAYYCEENIWKLCQEREFWESTCRVVFISNPLRCVPLWFQQAAPSPQEPVFWDYHVILLRAHDTGWMVWDFDTLLGLPLSIDTYLAQTFILTAQLEARFAPFFRVIEPKAFVAEFASDRSHMQDELGAWLKPPPPWEAPINETGETMNLMQFVEMEQGFVGDVLSLEALRAQFGGAKLERA